MKVSSSAGTGRSAPWVVRPRPEEAAVTAHVSALPFPGATTAWRFNAVVKYVLISIITIYST